MLKRVLIANRGEIACRILRTLRALGVGAVVVYHHEDRTAPHVALADEAVLLEADVPTAAYLDAGQIIGAARRTGADAIHPGYGFLAENAAFAQQVQDAGLIFIGPDPAVIRLMGDKIRARAFAVAQGVPVAPSVGADGDFARAAASVGFPLLIKAAAGGGGRGMRIVRHTGELAESARIAAAEAERYFGDARIYAERYIERPRHIEVQIVGDGAGEVVHLHERECSLQRRYQKIVEESPAPNLPARTRDAICGAAVRLASAARYRNAGTVEFVLAPDGGFYFLEMNTRLQVEHPVTEAVLGLDLVAEQLRIAAGAGLSHAQGAPEPQGHAIECRICAEEPEHDFRPATGRIGVLRPPADARFDGGVREGQPITPAFDSLLGKLIAHGATRGEAAQKLERALHALVLLGVPTNVDYLARLVRHPEFLAGRLHTGFLAAHARELLPVENPDTAAAALLVALLSDEGFRRSAFDVPEPHATIGHWRN
ncbi:MAG TPA: biotin carboxylase N-terminal domain-containing protein [Steroidobacteraceae bacterium]|nr:biotin carboxylase N-terminal domain-containing protein [Steroidobacteraceae bacterium]